MRYVYFFGNGKSDGRSSMKQLLGGKGANLCEMVSLGLPVPPGFVISTETCDFYNKNAGQYPEEVKDQVAQAIAQVEGAMKQKFGSQSKPLLLSIRSGAAVSMPGMMDTVLNLGLNDQTVQSFSKETGNPAFVWDSYRRFIAMYSNVVGSCDMEPFEHVLWETKKKLNINADCDIPVSELKKICETYKGIYQKQIGKVFPQDPQTQLWESITAVFRSWNNPRAVKYRQLNNIKGLKGTAVNVQAMVYGNYNNASATGVCFSRNPSNGDPRFYGEWLVNAQGEDVVAGIRTPQQITKEASLQWAADHSISEVERSSKFPSMEERMPECYKELVDLKNLLENHFRDMQDMEFTIQDGRLFFLQTRNGKRTTPAAVRIAKDMVTEGLIDKKTAVSRIDCEQIDQLLHPYIDPSAKVNVWGKGLPASPGAGVGQIVFTADAAEAWQAEGKSVIMVRVETSPEDLGGMNAACGILTARGGMTSHAAVVARGMGKPCICGVSDLVIDYKAKTVTMKGKTLKEGEWLSLNGTKGEVIIGKVPLVKPTVQGSAFGEILTWASEIRTMGVRANADTPKDAATAYSFGAEGIGLCRTEHMFFEGDRIDSVREMILARDEAGRKKALKKILPYQKSDFVGLFKAMKGLPCTIRLLDPPLHEFVPHDAKAQADLAKKLGLTADAVANRVHELLEANPMLGHRGVRLGLTYPEIYDTQVEAIFEAACDVQKETGTSLIPEVMIPLVGKTEELTIMKKRCITIAENILEKRGVTMKYLVGTMIEVPRAAVTADEIAQEAEFFSFGTNDLTQMGCGFSRDDAASFLKHYVKLGIYDRDPFQVLDQEGVGQLVAMAVQKGRSARPGLKCGICGEHGGEPSSVKFCHRVGLDYVSCSPFRVPVAIVAAAQAAIEEEAALLATRRAIAKGSKL
eukprot:TRINITY_DN1569_c2_g1_i1.p1 TRINITY_DN1569_c2_g1~~TRINITY_DN1569_c2_g1_i1.p1  ORF type:complete len:934 (+),score=244.88 TRINITY_DN1569_c2_g1_i1:58-2802(+)